MRVGRAALCAPPITPTHAFGGRRTARPASFVIIVCQRHNLHGNHKISLMILINRERFHELPRLAIYAPESERGAVTRSTSAMPGPLRVTDPRSTDGRFMGRASSPPFR